MPMEWSLRMSDIKYLNSMPMEWSLRMSTAKIYADMYSSCIPS